jgi:hypothetical protein
VASSVFFDDEALPDQKPRERRRVGRDAAFGLQLGRQFRHRDVALRLHPSGQKGDVPVDVEIGGQALLTLSL